MSNVTKNLKIKTRFCPSPTGYLHIGGVRTALYNWLYAKKNGGKFVLRIDDTDEARNISDALHPILDGLDWLRLNWDEGPGLNSAYGPYFQSQRADKYAAVAERLRSGGQAYRGVMEKLTEGASIYKDDGGAIRLFMGREGKIVLNDMVKGRVEWNRRDIKDPVIVRSDGKALYNLATAVDDHDMQITHIFRAEEHLSNTPIQLRIYEAMEWEPPQFGHIPFVCAPGTKKKLSKRDMERFMTEDIKDTLKAVGYKDEEISGLNPATLGYYRAMGYLPDGVLNYLALIGWSKDGTTEYFSRDDLIRDFDVNGIHDAPAAFDLDKFRHINSLHMAKQPTPEKAIRCGDILNRAGVSTDGKIVKVVEAAGERLKVFSDIIPYGSCFFSEPVYDEKAFDKRIKKEKIPELLFLFSQGLDTISSNPIDLESYLYDFSDKNDVKFSDMVHAIRIAVTGKPVGIGLFDALSIFGCAEIQRRINVALKKV